MKIKIKNGYTLIDEGFEWILQYNPYVNRRGYVELYMPDSRKLFRAHRIITCATMFDTIDHINGIKHDNRLCNLRGVTQRQNCMNRRTNKNKKYKGTGYDASSGKLLKPWRTRIRVNGKSISIGRFSTELEAAIAYDSAAIKYFGEYACINFKRT